MNSTQSSYGLALHTCSPQLGIAIANFAETRRQQTWNLYREILNQMHLLLAEFLTPQTWSDLAFLAVAKVPGSFTGTRLGVVTARTLAQQLQIPLFAVSTLAAIAWKEAQQQEFNRPLCIAVQMPAQREQLFAGVYQIEAPQKLTTLWSDRAISPSDWQNLLQTLNQPYHQIEAPNELGDSAASLLELAHLDWLAYQRPHWQEALPFYGQHPVES
uniref:tRNA (Adenosine(37)-N6)-threonylcarbamoyltransferase complex dimerization subunit type 1 TsaB n=1 Tax=Desertifilum tharense IPPAS B-1220 TaxID=1781255 RepID=A0ACD5GS96_9CYAN